MGGRRKKKPAEDRILNIIRKIDFCVKESISKNLPIVKGPMLDRVAPV